MMACNRPRPGNWRGSGHDGRTETRKMCLRLSIRLQLQSMASQTGQLGVVVRRVRHLRQKRWRYGARAASIRIYKGKRLAFDLAAVGVVAQSRCLLLPSPVSSPVLLEAKLLFACSASSLLHASSRFVCLSEPLTGSLHGLKLKFLLDSGLYNTGRQKLCTWRPLLQGTSACRRTARLGGCS
ncbi:hypothetical protein IWX90DRAFT_301894 [Phyllosticta citrichinensis]|uniref:Uncharacterized protein n=1 Tax=Phyllosticta citrichinensis TaxID=1130410 RepID=A0ABR1XL71_9PEZI